MKKYLIKGLLALFVGGFVASCADDKVEYIPVEQQKASAYAEAFKELIGGEVSPNHDWGFKKTSITESASARTRAIDVNGNLWEETPECTAAEAKLVFDYVNMTRAQMTAAGHKYANPFPENIENYYVTQVYTGTDTYSTSDQTTTGILGSSKMDHLCIAMKSDAKLVDGALTGAASSWEHINNFNASSNMNWGGNTLVVNGGTRDFVYNCSEDSKYHNKWIAVKGDDIDASLKGKYYICFDFEAMLDQSYTPLTGGKFYNPHSPNSDKWENINGINDIKIPGQWTNETVRNSGYTMEYTYSYWEDGVEKWDTITLDFSDENSVRDINCGNYVGGNMEIPANDVYTDWIVRIVPAVSAGSGNSSIVDRTDLVERWRLVQQGRIFCEDLGTNKITTSDIDFNDAVFDAKIWRVGQFDVYYHNGQYNGESDYITGAYPDGLENGKFKYVAEIRLLAAGGTVQLKIGGNNGFEIHSKFGEGNGRTIGHTTIINTMGAPSQAQFTTTVSTDQCEAVTEKVDITYLVAGKSEIGLDIIPIEVMWSSGTNNTVGELEANYGQAPQKLCVPIGTPWVYERIPITSAYKDFDNYARNYTAENNLTFWASNNTIDESLLYPSDPEGMTPEAICTDDVNSNSYFDVTVEEGDPTTTTETVIWDGEVTFATAAENGSLSTTYTLTTKDFNVGDRLRVYGVAYGSNPWVSIHDGSVDPWVGYAGCAVPGAGAENQYTDIIVTQEMIDKMTLTVGFWGKDCTITRLSRIVISN